MTFPKPGPQPGGFRPGPPPVPRPPTHPPAHPQGAPGAGPVSLPPAVDEATGRFVEQTGHPAVDEVLRSLANAARLAPAEQIAEYEAAHQVLQETLAGIDR
ncbi:hypothetical protein Aab01nite_83260 [Paractinoplanes abujensis]|uniref:Uncharacterized protein n=1 Tax=Paractinoplanes abujensis TaxID=882441 RepID=A0A7W7FYN7_9ACTN|nr:hypothetical protein [Actinoplanes abujensis]MBB4689859.1 hypothetical protein [Actinoplanes abujensis]GID24736.1 hypothetical protein Aab01nite_83260 [Actinoplanes abujensis]